MSCNISSFAVLPISLWNQTLAAPYQKAPLDTRFYSKFTVTQGFPIVSSSKTSDAALRISAKWSCLLFNLANPSVVKNLTASASKLIIMAATEKTIDIPEFKDMKPAANATEVARGLGGTENTLVGEENVLCAEEDKWNGQSECILLHELGGHTMSDMSGDEQLVQAINSTYQSAMKKGLFPNTYAATNQYEYWAEGVESWFDCNLLVQAWMGDGIDNDIDTRDKIKSYDPDLAVLLKKVFGDNVLRYQCPTDAERVEAANVAPVASQTLKPEKTSFTSYLAPSLSLFFTIVFL
ncbi:hypothetical protein BC830DRAFT_1175982 [Chytriomyces sp. MP71]|nr:hypothetical protein BC830DRAFT_1175982 [Chytriomyces sp. MP71]